MSDAPTGPDPADVATLRQMLDATQNFSDNDQRARYLLTSDWLRDRGAGAANRIRDVAAPIASTLQPTEALEVTQDGRWSHKDPDLNTIDGTGTGTGTDSIETEASLSKLLAIYEAQASQRLTREAIATLTAQGKDASSLIARSDTEQVTALDALRAGDRISKLVTGWSWILMRQAREEGRSWAEIGAALTTTKQEAFDYYRNAVDRQEKYAPKYSDIAAARKVQGDPDN